MQFYKNKKILITGHTGFKGAWLSQILVGFGAEITGIALPPENDNNLFDVLGLKNKINSIICDIRDFQAISDVIKREKPEIVFHLAAQPIVRRSYDDPICTYSTNVMGTVNVLQAVKDVDSVKSCVIITTDKVYENNSDGRLHKEDDKLGGHDPYSASKAAADIISQSYIDSFFTPGQDRALVATARAGNVIGGGDWSNDRLIPDFIRSVFEDNSHVAIRNPEAIRPWQHVLEPLSGYMILAKRLHERDLDAAGAWNFGPGHNQCASVESLIKEAIGVLGKGGYLVKASLDKEKKEASILQLDSKKAEQFLHWNQKLDLKEGLGLALDWYREFYVNRGDIVNFTNKQIHQFFKQYE